MNLPIYSPFVNAKLDKSKVIKAPKNNFAMR